MIRYAFGLALFCAPAVAQDFAPIHEVLSHPRCTNCHVDAAGIPLWSDGDDTRPHGFHVRAGESRMGIETTPCGTCHGLQNTTLEGGAPGAPHWGLPPAEMAWAGRSAAEICNQLKDPERNGGRSLQEIANHIREDPLVLWGWAPGPGRTAAPATPEALAEAVLDWAAAGAPCP
ncbi:MAG: hypothetical protein AAF919_06510 [Pseudomonadota bacterium]